MKCFSRETDREILSDFIRLGQGLWSDYLISSAFLFSLAFFSFFFRQPPRTCPPRQKTWKKGKKGNPQEKVRHVKRVCPHYIISIL